MLVLITDVMVCTYNNVKPSLRITNEHSGRMVCELLLPELNCARAVHAAFSFRNDSSGTGGAHRCENQAELESVVGARGGPFL